MLLKKVIIYYNQDEGAYCNYDVKPKTLAGGGIEFIEQYLNSVYKKDYSKAKKLALEFCRYLIQDKVIV